MVKKAILLLTATAALSGTAVAQHCGTDEMHKEYIQMHPEIVGYQQSLDAQIRAGLAHMRLETAQRIVRPYTGLQDTIYMQATDTMVYIPVVVHVIHDYGDENVSDATIFQMMDDLNEVYAGTNTSDLANVIPTFQPYIGSPNIEFRLATKDPLGNPTRGITREHSYLTNGGDDQAKLNQWAPDRYLNIWVEKKIGRTSTGGTILAYATLPSGAAASPFTDGIISGFQYLTNFQKTIEHEVGHYLNLYHPWNSSEKNAGVECGDDEVDDTPPTKGHASTCPLYDTACATGYFKAYPAAGGAIDTVDYPDTTNVQNIMDYSSCPRMFTKLQSIRMREALSNSIGARDSLLQISTHDATGIRINGSYANYRLPDLPPVADFYIGKGIGLNAERLVFLCNDNQTTQNFIFRDASWGDTVITGRDWTFSQNGNILQQESGTNITTNFNATGWITVELKATSNAGTGTVTRQAVYVADKSNAINPQNGGYYEDFAGSTDNWPMFNYYNNSHRWKVNTGTGFYDNTSIQYQNFDARVYPYNIKSTPGGDFDDLYTPAFNLSGYATSTNCNLNYMYAGTFATTVSEFMNDTLLVQYSTDCGSNWSTMKTLTKKDIGVNGTYTQPYMPQWMGEWALQSINVPQQARVDGVFFRFRFKPGVNTDSYFRPGTGNNFYMDRLNISDFPLGVNTMVKGENTIAVAPNPTSGASTVVIKGTSNTTATVQVTDLTGKVVYTTQKEIVKGRETSVEIPATAIAVKGLYMVQVNTGSETQTEKLVVY